jgi:hypothetical protein
MVMSLFWEQSGWLASGQSSRRMSVGLLLVNTHD